jgi:hypothetical protein
LIYGARRWPKGGGFVLWTGTRVVLSLAPVAPIRI